MRYPSRHFRGIRTAVRLLVAMVIVGLMCALYLFVLSRGAIL